jgi:hypothetical protein
MVAGTLLVALALPVGAQDEDLPPPPVADPPPEAERAPPPSRRPVQPSRERPQNGSREGERNGMRSDPRDAQPVWERRRRPQRRARPSEGLEEEDWFDTWFRPRALAIDFLVGPVFMDQPLQYETSLDLGGLVAVDIGRHFLFELRYQYASHEFGNEILTTRTGYHAITPAVGAGFTYGWTFFYGLAGASAELTNVTHTLDGPYGTGSWAGTGVHLGGLFGAGMRVRVPMRFNPEARLEFDWRRRGQFNDMVLAVMLGFVPFGGDESG